MIQLHPFTPKGVVTAKKQTPTWCSSAASANSHCPTGRRCALKKQQSKTGYDAGALGRHQECVTRQTGPLGTRPMLLDTSCAQAMQTEASPWLHSCRQPNTLSSHTLQAAAAGAGQQWPHNNSATRSTSSKKLRGRSFLHLALVHSARGKERQQAERTLGQAAFHDVKVTSSRS